jgi:hypothetical protein
METAITVRYRLTFDSLIEGYHVDRRLNRGKFIRAWLFAAGLYACVWFCSVYWNFRFNIPVLDFFLPGGPFDLAILALCSLFVTNLGIRVLARITLAGTPEESRDIEWYFSSAGLERRTTLESVSVPWEKVRRVAELPSGFLLQRVGTIWDWIPLGSFASLEDAREFARLASMLAECYVLLEEEGVRAEARPVRHAVDG